MVEYTMHLLKKYIRIIGIPSRSFPISIQMREHTGRPFLFQFPSYRSSISSELSASEGSASDWSCRESTIDASDNSVGLVDLRVLEPLGMMVVFDRSGFW